MWRKVDRATALTSLDFEALDGIRWVDRNLNFPF